MPYRNRIDLDGQWNFWIDPEAGFSPASLPADLAASITVPAPWQAESADLHLYSGVAWYQRRLEIPAGWLEGGAIILGFDAADYFAEAWLNGIKTGEHEGGYLPFEFDVTGAVRPGLNTLTVRVDDPPSLFPEVPHGKQGWYGPLSGLWQSVWMERRAPVHIQKIQIFADPGGGCAEVQVSLSGPVEPGYRILARVTSPEGETAAKLRVELAAGRRGTNLEVVIPSPLRWSPETPYLYRAEVRLEGEAGTEDVQSKQFGFRKIEARGGKLYLNDQLLYLRGVLDQDYYLDTLYTTPSIALLEDQIRKAKEMGLNCLRCHIKVADPRYYEVADRMGMLVWTELPNWSVLTDDSGKRGIETMVGILERDGHHPSIIIWTIINENWGTDLVNDPSHRAWLKDTYRWLKSLDPTRLVVDNSPCLPNFHVQTDLEDFHFYRAIPDQRKEWDQFVQEFASHPGWTFCPNGDMVRTGEEPLVVSEFGNWGLPDADLLVDAQGRDPWWFQTGFEWSHGVVYPEGVRQRFRNLGLERSFGSWKQFVEATQWQQYLALKYEIEAMRRQPEIAGYVITELTDVHWECNGLLDMRRNPKVFHHKLKNVNADTILIPVWERVAYWPGETVEIRLEVAHSSGQALPPSEIHWSLASGLAAGRLIVPALQPGQVQEVGSLTFRAPEVLMPLVQQLRLELHSASGETIAVNCVDLSLYPRRIAPGSPGALLRDSDPLYTDDDGLAGRLLALGYQVTPDLDRAALALTGQVTEELLGYLRAGGRLLVLADRADQAGPLLPGIRLEARQGTPWIGDWASAFSWLNRQGPFSRLPGGPLIDHSFDRVIPEYVLVGFRDWDFRSLVHAGIVVGWVHKPAATIGERCYGKGRAVLNTFRLEDEALGADPTATALLDGLIELTLCKA